MPAFRNLFEAMFQLLGVERLNRLAGSINLCWVASAAVVVIRLARQGLQGKEQEHQNAKAARSRGRERGKRTDAIGRAGLDFQSAFTRPGAVAVGRI